MSRGTDDGHGGKGGTDHSKWAWGDKSDDLGAEEMEAMDWVQSLQLHRWGQTALTMLQAATQQALRDSEQSARPSGWRSEGHDSRIACPEPDNKWNDQPRRCWCQSNCGYCWAPCVRPPFEPHTHHRCKDHVDEDKPRRRNRHDRNKH